MRDWKALVRSRLEPLPVDAARAAEIVAELAQHVAQHHAELVASGVDDRDALERALAPLNDPRRLSREIARTDRPRRAAPDPPGERSGRLLAGLGRDFRYAARLLVREPGFAAAAVVTLALGIAANTTIFSMLNAVLLRPLPYADPPRLVYVGERGDSGPGNTGYATYLDWKAANHSFEDMAVIRSWAPTLVVNGQPERIAGMRVSSNFFRLLGVHPQLGRDLRADDDTPARWRVVLISDSLWRRRFDADPTVVGRVLRMNDLDFEIVGVMPPAFEPLISEHFYQPADMWAALGYDTSLSSACRSCQHLKALARLRPATTLEAAIADINGVHAAVRGRFPSQYPPSAQVAVRPLSEELTGHTRPALIALMGAVAFVLLIACANVASLLLARLARRQQDLALRAALGASRGRIVRQLMAEALLLALAGGALGIALSGAAVPVLTSLTPFTLSRLDHARLDAPVLAYGLGVSAVAALVFGLLPAIRASRVDLSGAIASDGRRTVSGPGSVARRVLVAADVALALVLLAGAGLMVRSVSALLGVNPGFDPDRVLTMQMSMVGQRYREDSAVVRTGDEILASIRAIPGVTATALAGQIPLGGSGDRWGFHVEGRPITPDDPSVERYSVTPDYFAVMRIPLIRGRLISESDRAGTEPVMLIGEHTARVLWPGSDPLGQRVRIGGSTGTPFTIVGIVGDVRHQELARPPALQMYLAQRQVTDSFVTVVVRAAGADVSRLTDGVRRAVWSAASDVPIYQVATLADLVSKSAGPRRFVMLLLGLFAAIAVLMTAVGVYGVVAYSVAERTREIGVRAALGASRTDIAWLVVGMGMAVVVAGLLVGAIAAVGATRLLQSSLFGVEAGDPLTLAGVTVVLLLVTLLAHVLPVLRATRVDPALALRQD
jgi:putative ABC transport system permease protein